MGEFGHQGIIGSSFCIDAWGAGPFTIEVCSRHFTFEDSDRFGPSIVTRTGEVAERQPREGSEFWRAHRIWVRQGRRVDGARCLWDEPKPTTYKRINNRNSLIVENGDEDGRMICIGQATAADTEPPPHV